MGGNLFKNERMTRDEYVTLQIAIGSRVNDLYYMGEGFKLAIPLTFRVKDDFGDLDVVIASKAFKDKRDILSNQNQLRHLLRDVFNFDEFSWNDTVLSVNMPFSSNGERRFAQVDFCFFPEEDFNTAVKYMSFGDTSNMIGVIMNEAFGMRLTHRGLVLPVKLSDSQVLGEVVVSKDWEKILKFADLDYSFWAHGFVKQNQVFNWLADSKYFNADFFKFENLNHQNRTRNRKWAMYSDFVKWISVCEKALRKEPPQSHIYHLWRAIGHFDTDSFVTDASELIYEFNFAKASSEVWNGKHIQEITGLSGEALGKCKKDFESFYKDEYSPNPKYPFFGTTTKQVEGIFKKWRESGKLK